MKRLLALLVLLFAVQVSALQHIPESISGYLDDDGDQLENGYVAFYSTSGLSSFKDVYSDYAGTTAVSQTGYGMQLNSSGQPSTVLFGNGIYWVVLRDADAVIVSTYEQVVYSEASSSDNTPWINISDVYGEDDSDMQTALAAYTSSATKVTFMLDGDFTISSTQTIPSHIRLWLVNGATLTVDAGNTLTLNSKDVVFDNNSYITNAGTVAFNDCHIVDNDNLDILQGAGTYSGTITNRLAPVEWFGAVGDGVTDDTAEILVGITFTAQAGIKLEFSPSTNYVCGDIDIVDNIDIVGNGATVSRAVGAADGRDWWQSTTGGYTTKIKGLVFQNNRSEAQSAYPSNGRIMLALQTPLLMEVTECIFTGGYWRAAIRVNIFENEGADGDLLIEDCLFIDGNSGGGLNINAWDDDSECARVNINRNEFIDVGSSVLAVWSAPPTLGEEYDTFQSVRITNNTIEPNSSGIYGPQIFELKGCNDAIFSGNTIIGGLGSGISYCRSFTAVGNTGRDIADELFEIGETETVALIGNTLTNCGGIYTNAGSDDDISGTMVIADNVMNGSSFSSYSNNRYAILQAPNPYLQENTLISGNLFKNLTYMDGAVRWRGDGALIVNNQMLSSSANACVGFIAAEGENNVIASNIYNRTADYTSDSPSYDNVPAVIRLTASANTVVRDNYISNSGSVTGNGVMAIGANSGALNYPAKVMRNVIVGNFRTAIGINDNGGNLLVINNDLSSATATTNYSIGTSVYKLTTRDFESTATPNAGTYLKGDRVWNTNGSTGTPAGWTCTAAGTPGTWKAMADLQ